MEEMDRRVLYRVILDAHCVLGALDVIKQLLQYEDKKIILSFIKTWENDYNNLIDSTRKQLLADEIESGEI